MLSNLLWSIECEASFCIARGHRVSPEPFISDKQPYDPWRKRFLKVYIVEKEACKQGISVRRYRAMERASRKPKPRTRQRRLTL